MASEFQRCKVRGMFAAFDADGDGYLCRADFEALAVRWGGLPAVVPGSALGVRLEAIMMGWWDALCEAADADGDHRVDLEELMAMVDRLPAMAEAVTSTAEAIFDAVDTNADGRISESEHRRLVETWNGRPAELGEVFDLLDLDGDGYLTRAEFALLWLQFWTSDNPADPGNYLTGPLPA